MDYLIKLFNVDSIKYAFAILAGFLISITGWTELMVYAVLAIIGVDTLFGIIRALSNQDEQFTSRDFSRVFFKLIVYFGTAVAAYVFGLVTAEMGVPAVNEMAPNAIFGFIIFTEFKSVLENAISLGLPLPKDLLDKLKGSK